MRFFALLFLFSCFSEAQEKVVISGKVIDENQLPLANVIVVLEGTQLQFNSDKNGLFIFKTNLKGNYILNISAKDFVTKRLPLLLDDNDIDLSELILNRDIAVEQIDNLITLTENDLFDDEGVISSSVGLLQASRDIFLNRAAFDFGQAFFRVRGYDSREGHVLINGLPMNKFFDGRPQWNNWGGLNDVIRNQEFSNGLETSKMTFGGILGTTNMDIRPSGLRSGTRLSSSLSNRTYAGRIMATYNSGAKENGLAHTLSASRRWAKEGFIDGTLYDAYSFFGALEYRLGTKNTIVASAIAAKNRRGRSSAITEEIFELIGNQYNPYWGEQNGEIRNSRERDIFEPILMFNHYYQSKKFRFITGIAFQSGHRSRSRLGYFNAPNPDPTYYRYLPSFYINNPIGTDFTNANLARQGFLHNPQINWSQLYTANTSPENQGKAAYVLYDDTVDDTQWTFAGSGSLVLDHALQLDFGLSYRNLASENYAEIQDLLGAEFHEDIDPFSDTKNDVSGKLNKTEDEIFNYHYDINASEWNGFAQLNYSKNQWSGFVSGRISKTNYQREGRFQNERFLENSQGRSKQVGFSNFGMKSGLTYQITGRHWVKLHAAYLQRPPTLQNTFINPRENNDVVPDLNFETLTTVDANYFLRLPDVTGRLTGFYSRFQNTTDINFFFVDAGVGSDFVQEVITDLDRLHMGIELGLEYQASPEVKLSLVANLGRYLFASNPGVSINFDTAGAEEDVINPEGNISLGRADIKNLRLAQGPQTAMAFGIEYRNPKYWWVGATANYLADTYASISTITRTPSFILNPDTGAPFPDATQENVAALLKQQSLDNFYLLNLVGGKSWLIDGKYLSFFLSINNVFDEVFRTGGFEQSRNGNFGQLQQDNLRNDPSFAPRYWYGFGRTFFLNLAIGF